MSDTVDLFHVFCLHDFVLNVAYPYCFFSVVVSCFTHKDFVCLPVFFVAEFTTAVSSTLMLFSVCSFLTLCNELGGDAQL